MSAARHAQTRAGSKYQAGLLFDSLSASVYNLLLLYDGVSVTRPSTGHACMQVAEELIAGLVQLLTVPAAERHAGA